MEFRETFKRAFKQRDLVVLMVQMVNAFNTGDPGLISGLGRSPVEVNDNPIQ